jgi:hypothetical protein
VTFLIEALIAAGETFFPWGYPLVLPGARCVWRETSLMLHLLSSDISNTQGREVNTPPKAVASASRTIRPVLGEARREVARREAG